MRVFPSQKEQFFRKIMAGKAAKCDIMKKDAVNSNGRGKGMMKKAVLFGIVAAALGLLAAPHSLAAGKLECDIVKVENNIVTLDCGAKAKKKLHAGKKAIVQEKMEGC